MGKVTRDQVVEALGFQKSKGGALGRILIDLGYIKETDLNIALAAQKGLELVNLDGVMIAPIAINAVPAQIATTNKVLPIDFRSDDQKADSRHGQPGKLPRARRSAPADGLQRHRQDRRSDQIERLIQKHYNTAAEGISDVLKDLANDETLKDIKGRGESIDLETLKDAADSNPVRKLINLVLLQAIKDKASDIHFEPFEDEFKMRYRIDGILYEMMPPPAHIAAAISSRIKVMANPGHRRAPHAAGRAHRAEREQPADRPSRGRASDDVRRKRRHARARPIQRAA
jgi:type IV pilus assembly protein PilB